MEKSASRSGRITQGINKLQEHERITGFLEISRRSLVNNSFDGILTMIGIVMGQYLAGVKAPGTIVITGVAAAISLSISGWSSAYLAESAERQRELADLERISLIDLSRTKIARAARTATIIVSLANGLSPFVASLIVLVPFFLAAPIGSIALSYTLSLALALLSLFGLGVFLGHISGRSMIGYGIRTIAAGIVAIGVTRLLPTG
jgi:predicted membrane protein (TIGR00267 family)